jgi:hypothetical protein
MTFKGNPGKDGVVVATPAVPVRGAVVGVWMCDAVVSVVIPLKVTCTCIMRVTGSKSTSADPVAVDVLGGLSFGPVSVAKYMIGAAEDARVIAKSATASIGTTNRRSMGGTPVRNLKRLR